MKKLPYPYFWVNYNNSLTWIKAIWGWFPLLTISPSETNWNHPLPTSRLVSVMVTVAAPAALAHMAVMRPMGPAPLTKTWCPQPTWRPKKGWWVHVSSRKNVQKSTKAMGIVCVFIRVFLMRLNGIITWVCLKIGHPKNQWIIITLPIYLYLLKWPFLGIRFSDTPKWIWDDLLLYLFGGACVRGTRSSRNA